MPTVAAVIVPVDGIERAVGAQQRPPDEVVHARRGLGDALRRVADGRFDWIWIVDGTALPRAQALAELMDAAARLRDAGDLRLLASRVVEPDGTLAERHAPIAPQDLTRVAVQTVALRVLHIRAATGASVLVRPPAAGAPLPTGSGPAATTAWTAGLLRGGGGFLVPASIADVRAAPRAAREELELAARLLAGGGLRARERARYAADLVERTATAARRRRSPGR